MPEQAGKLAQAIYLSDMGVWFNELLAANFPKPVVKEILKTEGYLSKEELRERIKHMLADTRKLEYVIDLMQSMNPYDPRKAGVDNDLEQYAKIDKLPLEKVEAPTLVIHGTADADVKFEQARYAAEAIPGAEHYWIEGGTHLAFFVSDEAEEAQWAAADFLRRHLA